jgi:3-oxoacyl-[acyl-carrier protein] reductase
MNRNRLEGKAAVVTGAARGLGRAYALRLAQCGADVAVVDIDLRSFEQYDWERKLLTAESVVEEIRAMNRKAIGIELDLTIRDNAKVMVQRVMERFGRLDILVCNAGGMSGEMSGTAPSHIPDESLKRTLEMNFYSTVYCCQYASVPMKHQRYGKIVNVSSIAGIRPRKAGVAPYGLAKAIISTYTRYLAMELAPYSITVNAIAPGFIQTGRLMAGDLFKGVIDSIPAGRLGTPEDCAGVVEFLCTDLSRYVTGQVIVVDGGVILSPS